MDYSSKIRAWLLLSILCVIVMVVIGGYTRLTGSGLSIVDWQPVTGILPPLSDIAWDHEFVKYKQSPEYQKINIDFSVEEFKKIYYIEYFHRLMGRAFAIIFAVPLFYFLYSGSLTRKQIRAQCGILILLLFQGFIGWYMVRSGLVSNPHVSHFRLALHLLIACILLHMLLNQYFQFLNPVLLENKEPYKDRKKIATHMSFIILNIYIQIISGGLVAGLHGGLVYNSFPLMNGDFIPKEISDSSSVFDIFTSPGAVQFIHRVIAYFLLVNILFFCYRLVRFCREEKKSMGIVYLLLSLIFLQIILGIGTLLLVVPISLALLHQSCGILLLITSIYALHSLRDTKESINARL